MNSVLRLEHFPVVFIWRKRKKRRKLERRSKWMESPSRKERRKWSQSWMKKRNEVERKSECMYEFVECEQDTIISIPKINILSRHVITLYLTVSPRAMERGKTRSIFIPLHFRSAPIQKFYVPSLNTEFSSFFLFSQLGGSKENKRNETNVFHIKCNLTLGFIQKRNSFLVSLIFVPFKTWSKNTFDTCSFKE